MPTAKARSDGKLLMFGSLKGGAGKTTLSLLAVEALLAQREATRAEAPRSAGVILIDADVVGTEASDVVGTEYTPHKRSLAEIIGHVATDKSAYVWLQDEIRGLVDRGGGRYLIPSFGDMLAEQRTVWREVLEHSELYIQRRMRDLVGACRAHHLDVVIDLPAFDVGFAAQVRQGLAAEEPAPAMFFVTDCDVRSVRATLTHRARSAPTSRIAINRVPDRDHQLESLAPHDSVFVPEVPEVLVATRANEAGGEGGTGNWEIPLAPLEDAPLHARLRDMLNLAPNGSLLRHVLLGEAQTAPSKTVGSRSRRRGRGGRPPRSQKGPTR